MVQITGYLKDNAMYGEKKVFESLSQYLPKEWSVYVECPLHHDGLERMPDFIVVTDFGVVVLEVKDWVKFNATRFEVTVHSKTGKVHKEKSPVRTARDFALILAKMLETQPQLMNRDRGKLKVPWGYAVVFAHAKPNHLQDLRKLWGDHNVLGLGDLQPAVITRRLKATLPFNYELRQEDLIAIRSVVNPSVSITIKTGDDKIRKVTLDEVQESLVTESPRTPPLPPAREELITTLTTDQLSLLPKTKKPTPKTATADIVSEQPAKVKAIMENFSIRLVRGVAGSGKTVVLLQRARYLAAQHPQWRIGVLTFNKALQEILRGNLKGIPQIKVTTFDALCSNLLKTVRPWSEPANAEGWVKHELSNLPIVAELGAGFFADEIKWIKDTGVLTREIYLDVDRRGRGQGLRRGGRQREALWDALELYNAWLDSEGTCDWADLPQLVQTAIAENRIFPDLFDAVLVDEAQDFAPSWFALIKELIHPETGILFLTDDPSQSIFRSFSWREKGVAVVGRTRWLRVPYRNTREIYEAAYEVIRNDEILRQELSEQTGVVIEPDFTSTILRHGPLPQIRQFRTTSDEHQFILNEIHYLQQKQICDVKGIVVLHRRKAGVNRLQRALRKSGVRVETFHSMKGLEYEVVFLAGMEGTFPDSVNSSLQALSSERRLVYMAMTRARKQLYLTYHGQWPTSLSGVLPFAETGLL